MNGRTHAICILQKQNKELMLEDQKLRNKNEELKAELRRHERMTPSESAAYWGIFGSFPNFCIFLTIEKML